MARKWKKDICKEQGLDGIIENEKLSFQTTNDNVTRVVAFLNHYYLDAEYHEDRPDEGIIRPDVFEEALLTIRDRLPTEKDQHNSVIVLDSLLLGINNVELRRKYMEDGSRMTYWSATKEETQQSMGDVNNWDQDRHVWKQQKSLLENALDKAKKILPYANFVLNIFDDDTAASVNSLERENANRLARTAAQNIQDGKQKLETLEKAINTYSKEMEKASGCESKKDAIIYEDQARDKLDEQLFEVSNDLKGYRSGLKGETLRDKAKASIEKLTTDLTVWQEQHDFYKRREKKTRPSHQFRRGASWEKIRSEYQEICDSRNIKLLTSDAEIDIGGFKFKYQHYGHDTYNPILARADKLIKEVTGREEEFIGLDMLIESGHSGIFSVEDVKLTLTTDEINMEGHGKIDPNISKSNLIVANVPPLENQEGISRYTNGRKPERTGGGKLLNSKGHPVRNRYSKGGVSGIALFFKDEEDRIGFSIVDYDKLEEAAYKQRNVPLEKKVGVLIANDFNFVASDLHQRSPGSIEIMVKGIKEVYLELLKDGMLLQGIELKAQRYIDVGDAIEPNRHAWRNYYGEAPSPMKVEEIFAKEIGEFALYVNENGINMETEQIAQKISQMGADLAKMNISNNMDEIIDWATDWYWEILTESLEYSMAQHAFLMIPGNHADGVLIKSSGGSEHFALQQRCKATNIPHYRSGRRNWMNSYSRNEQDRIQNANDKEKARVWFGGVETARVLAVDDIGMEIDPKTGERYVPEGKETYKLVLHHDPKGSKEQGVIGAGKRANADLMLAGHTHINRWRAYKKSNNEIRFYARIPAGTQPEATEINYASGHARQQGACAYSFEPGNLTVLNFSSEYLMNKGREMMKNYILEQLKIES